MVSGQRTYGGIKVPLSIKKSDAELYIRTSAKINARALADRRPQAPKLIEHHYLALAKIRNEEYINRVVKGVRKHVDPNVKLMERHLRKHLRLHRGQFDSRRQGILDRLKHEKQELLKHGGETTRQIERDRKAKDKFLKDIVTHKMKREAEFGTRADTGSKIDLIKATYDNRDLGVAVGSGTDEDANYDKLIEVLKRGLPLSRAATLGIIKSKKALDRIAQVFGKQYVYENFTSRIKEVKYTSDKWIYPKYTGGYKPKYYKRGDLGSRFKKATQDTKKMFYDKVRNSMKKK